MVGVIKKYIIMSSTPGVSATTSNKGTTDAYATLHGSAKALDQNDFLKLLVTQIQFQNPMNPKSDTDMAAQMAQFTSLQQATQTSSSLSMIQANSLIGSKVTLQIDYNHTEQGVVEGVRLVGGKPQIMVDGIGYEVGQVIAVSPATTSGTTTETTPNA